MQELAAHMEPRHQAKEVQIETEEIRSELSFGERSF
jgi:hypothetical protein